MNYSTLVFGQADDIDTMMAPYYEHDRVEPYWSELPERYVQKFVEIFTIANPNMTEDELLEAHYGDQWKKISGKWHERTTRNPEGYWDAHECDWDWSGNYSPAGKSCLSHETPDSFVPDAFVDELGWHWRYEDGVSPDEWEKTYRDAIKKYNGEVTLVHCHR